MSEDRYDNEMFAALPQGEDLKRYIEEGWPVHHFLTALLENDLMECVGRADERNFDALDAGIRYQRQVLGWCAAKDRVIQAETIDDVQHR